MSDDTLELSAEEKIQVTMNALRNVLVQEEQAHLALLVNNLPGQNAPLAAKLKDLQVAKGKLQARIKELQDEIEKG